MTHKRFAVSAGLVLLAMCLSLAAATQQKPAPRASSAAPAGNAVAVYKSPT